MTLRRQPSDFAVAESLAPAARAAIRPKAAPGCLHAVYMQRKTSLTTPEAGERLARALRVPISAIEYGGLKDKHAETMQHVTVRARDAQGAASLARSAEGPGWSAVCIGWTSHPINAEWIDRNAFAIVVRGLSADAARRMDERGAWLRDPGGAHRLLVVNYFGAQRFGSARHGQGFAARRLVEGDFEGALRLLIGTPARKDSGPRRAFTRALAAQWGDWGTLAGSLPAMPEREAVRVLAHGGSLKNAFLALPEFLKQMCVDAYQSHLWNRAACALVRTLPEPRAFTADDDFGPLAFAPAGALPGAWRAARLPMGAPGLTGPFAEYVAGVLAGDGLTAERLTIPGVRQPAFQSFDRPLIVAAEGFEMRAPEPDDLADTGTSAPFKRIVRFSLPSGSYATVVLRALGE